MVSQLKEGEFNPYYETYINKAESPDIVKGLESSQKEFVDFVQSIPDEKLTHAYAKDKWTVAEVLQHVIDGERIFAYRALRFARNDKTPIMGFEQDDYVPYSNANNYSKEELISDFQSARNNSISLFKSFTGEMLTRIGEASGSPMSSRAAGYILIGHQKHHFEVIKERYL
ncbi:putative damage-inducible protein DinB [Aquimarina sp. EL_43]|uniref:DinB family protein n=1 Tax=unclassified Aquimarina TaxID=2627091 RepID=UPI0018C9D73B|nr:MULTISPECIES: DinB family protein [unclassified Aquimarina]MBG6129815.1 putative damage-inducible protein DinB [Aquimarina sp. EL_35]MBG6150880.1 putative damage-inducible protein DinB [Aquimarina sp. EL_32]MBG6167813.1 putative damage-inducible protein DinB [Aquimarina sp. EL_43]